MKHDAEVHNQHRAWHNENTSMLDDLSMWQTEYERALASLAMSESVMRDHGAALGEHRLTLSRQERALGEHEESVAAMQQAGVDDATDPRDEMHAMVAHSHSAQMAAHERVKAHHHKVVAEVTRLRKVLESAM